MRKLKLWWKWRKAKRREYPLRYIGPTHTVRGTEIQHGTPLRFQAGPRGAPSAGRYLAPDGIIRLLPTSQIEVR
jgi:hypothetical protein